MSDRSSPVFDDAAKPWQLRFEFPLAQTLMAIAQLSAGDPLLMEIVELAKLEEKVGPILQKLTHQLESQNNSYVPLLSPLLWSSIALDFNDTTEQFSKRAIELSKEALDRIPYASKVLLNQSLQYLGEADDHHLS